MQITRSSVATAPGPDDWFTGAVYIDAVATPSDTSRVSASSVHFTPGARTAWHTHPNGQTIYVTEGVGLAQRRGGPVEVIPPVTASSSTRARSTGTALRRRGS
jgi:quercetin dioxygenase-like cupin family protein